MLREVSSIFAQEEKISPLTVSLRPAEDGLIMVSGPTGAAKPCSPADQDVLLRMRRITSWSIFALLR
jgi:hypothetical protein